MAVPICSNLKPILEIEEIQAFVPKKTASWAPREEPRKIDCVFDRGDGVYGLPFNYIISSMGTKIIPIKSFHRVKRWTMDFVPRDYQVSVIKEATAHLNEQRSCILQVYAGFGKTHTSLCLAAKINRKYQLATCIVLPDNKGIRKGWIKMLTHLGVKYAVLGDPKCNIHEDDIQIYVTMKTALTKVPREVLKKIGTIIVDEAHLFCTNIAIQELLRFTPAYVIMLTATFTRADGLHRALELIAGTKCIIRKDPKPFLIFKVPTPFTPVDFRMTTRGKMWSDVQKKYDAMEDRTEMICDFVKWNLDLKTLILTKHVDRANLLCNKLNAEGVVCSILAGNIDSYEDKGVLVATFSKVGTGYDEQNACESWNGKRLELLIVDASVKKIEQYAGRVARASNPCIIFPVDNLSNNKQHYKECSKWWTDPERNAKEIQMKFGVPFKVSEYLAYYSKE